MKIRTKKTPEVTGDVVATLQEQVRQAQALAAVPEQKLLSDPKLNPTTRGLSDSLTTARLQTELELEHRRELRRGREQDRKEERAARRAAAIDNAREATSDANIALDMTTRRRRFTLGALGASLLCSVGSAMGVEAAVQAAYPEAFDGVGYLAEVGLTGMATMAIAWRGGLAGSKAKLDGLPVPVLNAMIAVPLLASIIASTAGSGPVGAVCSIAAAAFAWMAYLISVTGAEAITQAVTRMDAETAREDVEDQGDEELPRRSDRDRDALEVVGEEIADQAADFLRHQDHGGDHGGDDTSSPGGDDGSTGDIHPSTDAPPALEDAARRRSQSARQRVEDYYKDHPDAPVKRAAAELGVDPKTVRKYRPGSDARG